MPKSQPLAQKKPFYRNDPLTVILFTLGIYISSQILAAFLIGLYPAVRNWTEQQATSWLQDSTGAQFAYTLLAEVAVVSMVIGLIKRAGVLRSRLGLVRPAWRDLAYALAAYAVYFLSYLFIIGLVQALIPAINTEQKQQIGFDAAYGSGAIFLTFLSLVVLVPVAEEVLFRGYLFTALRAKLRLRWAIVVTSLLFGVLHLQFGSDAPLLWVAAIDTFVLSCFLCYLRERSGSLWPPIMLHAFKNLAAFLILFGPRFL